MSNDYGYDRDLALYENDVPITLQSHRIETQSSNQLPLHMEIEEFENDHDDQQDFTPYDSREQYSV